MIYLLLPAAYLIGGIPFGFLVGRCHGIDVREVGSGNIGATNVWRSCGPAAGSLVLLFDILKGLIPTLVAKYLAPDLAWLHVGVGAAAVVGHSFSPFLGMRGGKGVATSCGVAIALVPAILGCALLLFLLLMVTTRYVSLSCLLGALLVAIGVFVVETPLAYRVVVVLVVALIWLRHTSNLGRLVRGEERKFSWRKKTPETPETEAVAEPGEPVAGE